MTAETIPGTEPRVRAADVLAALRRHYLRDDRVPAGIFAAEIEAPGGGRRADLIWQGVTRAAGRELVGHEVKVSRADLVAELADLTKSDPWQRYCDRWWLVVPHESLIDGLELPPSWGVMTPAKSARGRSMVVVRPAPKLRPDEQAPALRALAARVHWELRDARAAAASEEKHSERLRGQLDGLRGERDEEAAAARQGPEYQLIARIVRELGGPSGPDEVGGWGSGPLDVETVVAALRDVQAARRAETDAVRRRDYVLRDLRVMENGLSRFLQANEVKK